MVSGLPQWRPEVPWQAVGLGLSPRLRPVPPRGLVPSLRKKCACDTRTQGSWRAGSILGGPDSPRGGGFTSGG